MLIHNFHHLADPGDISSELHNTFQIDLGPFFTSSSLRKSLLFHAGTMPQEQALCSTCGAVEGLVWGSTSRQHDLRHNTGSLSLSASQMHLGTRCVFIFMCQNWCEQLQETHIPSGNLASENVNLIPSPYY